MTAKAKQKRIPLHKQIWCKIRYYQQLNDISDEDMASYLGCCSKTLRNYDRNAKCLTLHDVDMFLYMNNITLEELMAA